MPKVEQEARGKRRRELSGTGYLKFLLFQKGDASDSQDAAVSDSELETARSRALHARRAGAPTGPPAARRTCRLQVSSALLRLPVAGFPSGNVSGRLPFFLMPFPPDPVPAFVVSKWASWWH